MNTTNPLTILVASIFTHNIALVYILGMCPFIVISKNFKTAAGMGVSVIFVVTLTAIINWPIYYKILLPANAEIVSYLIFIIVIAATVQLLEMLIEKFFPPLQSSFGTSVGWALAIIVMAAIKEKLMLVGDIPKGLRGAGITMIIAGLIAFAFMGFAGMITLQ